MAGNKNNDFIISIKPQYAFAIMSGDKSVELRRVFTQEVGEDAHALIYASSPVKALIGTAKIKDVQKLPINELWKKYGAKACITYKEFLTYFAGKKFGYALILRQPEKLNSFLELTFLQKKFQFRPPQSYQYMTDELHYLVSHEKRKSQISP